MLHSNKEDFDMKHLFIYITGLAVIITAPAYSQSNTGNASNRSTIAGHRVDVQTRTYGEPVYNPQAGTVQGSMSSTTATLKTDTTIQPSVNVTTDNPHPNQSQGSTSVSVGGSVDF